MGHSNQGSTTPNNAKRHTASNIAAKKTASKNKKTAAKTTTKTTSPEEIVSTEKRLQMIRELAYSLAEQRGFAAGDEQSDWLQAENKIDALLLK